MEDILFENEVALVLIVKNESRYIGEWLEYHYRIGVDKFYIYDNDSEDRSELLRVLDPWIQSGIVDLESVSGVRRQMPVYNNAIEKHRFDCRWMGFIDTDEFIYIKTGQNLPEFLHDYFAHEGVAGVGINWRMFGTSGRQKYESIDVIERFTMRAQDDYTPNLHIKTIANPRLMSYMPSPHHSRYLLGHACFDEHMELIPEYYNESNKCDLIQVNHYYTKSYGEFLEKLSRGRADIGVTRIVEKEKLIPVDTVEDVGLKNQWQKMKLQPLPTPKDHSQQKMLSNVKQMLMPFLGSDFPNKTLDKQIEKFMTCFFLVRNSKLLDTSEKITLENVILTLIKQHILHAPIDVFQMMLLLQIRAEILDTNLKVAHEIMKLVLSQIPKMIGIAESATMHQERFFLQQIQKDLKFILN